MRNYLSCLRIYIAIESSPAELNSIPRKGWSRFETTNCYALDKVE